MKQTSTFQLQLAPLPADRFESSSQSKVSTPAGFVDEEIIASLISQPQSSRYVSHSSDLVLSSDADDFAGFSVRSTSPFRVIAEKHDRATARPEPAVVEPGIGEPHRGEHRWWIAAATGAASALIVSLLFAGLAERNGSDEHLSSFSGPVKFLQSALGSLSP